MSYWEDDSPAGKPHRGDASVEAHLLVTAKRYLHLADQLDRSIRRCVIPGSPPQKIETWRPNIAPSRCFTTRWPFWPTFRSADSMAIRVRRTARDPRPLVLAEPFWRGRIIPGPFSWSGLASSSTERASGSSTA